QAARGSHVGHADRERVSVQSLEMKGKSRVKSSRGGASMCGKQSCLQAGLPAGFWRQPSNTAESRQECRLASRTAYPTSTRRIYHFCRLTFAFCLLTWFSNPAPAAEPSFSQDIAPILRDNCLACHSSVQKMGGLIMESHASLIKGGAHGAAIIPGKASE